MSNLQLLQAKVFFRRAKKRALASTSRYLICRGGVLEDVLGLEDTFWSPWPWPWPRSLRSSKIALSSARGQHYFWTVEILLKTPETSRKICKYLFYFAQLERRLSRAGREIFFSTMVLQIYYVTSCVPTFSFVLRSQFWLDPLYS